ncbi:MAG: hypothetical protein QXS91_00265 [Candidatus Anstonellales archaeon]
MNARKAVFLIDAMLSFTFLMLLLWHLIIFFQIYKVYEYDVRITTLTNNALILSYESIARDKRSDEVYGKQTCVIRFYQGSKVFCYEIT